MLNNNYTALAISVNTLDLEEGHDFLHFYDNTVSESTRLLSLTGHLADTSFLLDTRRLTMILETDESGTDAGFDLNYTGTKTGIDPHSAALSLYPNPATDHLILTYNEPVNQVFIRDLEGRTVYSGVFENEQVTVPVNQLRAGIYTITVQTTNSTVTRKFVKM